MKKYTGRLNAAFNDVSFFCFQGETCKKTWKNLKDAYGKRLRRSKEEMRQSGAGASEMNDPTVSYSPTVSNIKQENDEYAMNSEELMKELNEEDFEEKEESGGDKDCDSGESDGEWEWECSPNSECSPEVSESESGGDKDCDSGESDGEWECVVSESIISPEVSEGALKEVSALKKTTPKQNVENTPKTSLRRRAPKRSASDEIDLKLHFDLNDQSEDMAFANSIVPALKALSPESKSHAMLGINQVLHLYRFGKRPMM